MKSLELIYASIYIDSVVKMSFIERYSVSYPESLTISPEVSGLDRTRYGSIDFLLLIKPPSSHGLAFWIEGNRHFECTVYIAQGSTALYVTGSMTIILHKRTIPSVISCIGKHRWHRRPPIFRKLPEINHTRNCISNSREASSLTYYIRRGNATWRGYATKQLRVKLNEFSVELDDRGLKSCTSSENNLWTAYEPGSWSQGGYPDIWLIHELCDSDIWPGIKLEWCDWAEPGYISCPSRIV